MVYLNKLGMLVEFSIVWLGELMWEQFELKCADL